MPLEVHVVTPEGDVWSGEATMVVARGTEGELGILTGHAPALVRLATAPLRIHHAGGEETIRLAGGFLHVTGEGGSTRVDVLASGTDGDATPESGAAGT